MWQCHKKWSKTWFLQEGSFDFLHAKVEHFMSSDCLSCSVKMTLSRNIPRKNLVYTNIRNGLKPYKRQDYSAVIIIADMMQQSSLYTIHLLLMKFKYPSICKRDSCPKDLLPTRGKRSDNRSDRQFQFKTSWWVWPWQWGRQCAGASPDLRWHDALMVHAHGCHDA